jgi:hypothetical protein
VTRLVLQLDVPDDKVDPTLTDPEDLAEDIIGEYEEWATANGGIPVTVAGAEWAL